MIEKTPALPDGAQSLCTDFSCAHLCDSSRLKECRASSMQLPTCFSRTLQASGQPWVCDQILRPMAGGLGLGLELLALPQPRQKEKKSYLEQLQFPAWDMRPHSCNCLMLG